jgi:hypothetical protein
LRLQYCGKEFYISGCIWIAQVEFSVLDVVAVRFFVISYEKGSQLNFLNDGGCHNLSLSRDQKRNSEMV